MINTSAVWKEILEETKKMTEKDDDEMTVQDFADESGLSCRRAKHFLNNKVREGKMTKRLISVDGTRKSVYRPYKT